MSVPCSAATSSRSECSADAPHVWRPAGATRREEHMRSLPPSRRQVLGNVLASSGLLSLIDPPFGFCGRRRSYSGLPTRFFPLCRAIWKTGTVGCCSLPTPACSTRTTSPWNSCTRTRNALALFHDGGSVSSLFAPTLKRTGSI
jgi:hypothetical protein